MPRAASDPHIDPAERRRGRLLVGVVFAVVWGLITHGTYAGSGDEPHYMMIAHSLAFDADLDLANNYREATLIGAGTVVPEAHALAREGRLRPVHDIGMPLALAPAVRAAYSTAERLGKLLSMAGVDTKRLTPSLLLRHQISLVMALLTGFLAREVWLAIRDIGGAGWSAFGWALLFAVTPPILSHSFLFFTEIPAALIVLVVFRRLTLQPVRTAGMAALLGALTGFLWLVHARNIGIVAGLTLVAVGMTRRRALPTKLLTMFLVAVGLSVSVRTLVTFVLWGDFLTTPHAAFGVAGTGEAVREAFTRGTGLLFDREYGLFAYGPVYLLAGPGLWLFARFRPQLSRDLLVVLACYLIPVLLPMTNVHGWTGGWSPAARFLVPAASLLWLGVYLFASQAAARGRLLVAGLVLLQMAINAFVWQFPKTLWNDGDGVSALGWSQWLPTATDSGTNLSLAIALAALCAFAVLGSRWTVRPTAPEKPSPATSWSPD